MAEKIYYNSGALFKVKDKKSDKAPDYRTQIQLDEATLQSLIDCGGKLSIAGWLREGQGTKFVSLLVSADNYQKEASAGTTQRQEHKSFEKEQSIDEIDSDLPF